LEGLKSLVWICVKIIVRERDRDLEEICTKCSWDINFIVKSFKDDIKVVYRFVNLLIGSLKQMFIWKFMCW
jgi:hypothetical protein